MEVRSTSKEPKLIQRSHELKFMFMYKYQFQVQSTNSKPIPLHDLARDDGTFNFPFIWYFSVMQTKWSNAQHYCYFVDFFGETDSGD